MPDLQDAWSKTLELMAQDLAKPSEAWLKSAKPLAFHDNTLILAVPNNFAKTYLEDRLSGRVRQVLGVLLQRNVDLEFIVPAGTEMAADEELAAGEPAPAAPSSTQASRQFMNPKYRFETFVVGAGNRLAHAASVAVADDPGRSYNPLFIYGGVGLGKTHLMHAIAHRIIQRNPRVRVCYVSSETFANELIDAIRERRQLAFRNRYRNVDVLLVDDVQFIAGKESTQEEFFHTFNALHESRRQIVMSSDRPPKEIETLEERLRSRFASGLISDIQPPDLETRIAILHNKAEADGLMVPEEVIRFVGYQVNTNIRELEGALIRLVAYASLHHLELNEEVAAKALQDIVTQNHKRQVTPRLILETVATYYDLAEKEMTARKRSRNISYPRQIAMYLTRELTDFSLPRIGEAFGGRDHTTVLHAYVKIQHDIQADPALAATIHTLKKQILG